MKRRRVKVKQDRYVIGLDPGVSGAIAVVNTRGDLVDSFQLPVMPAPSASTRKIVDPIAFRSAVEGWCVPGSIATVEWVWGQNTQSRTSAFSFGNASGMAVAVLILLRLQYHFVTPQQWKKHFRLIGKQKKAAIPEVSRLYPDVEVENHNIADAILITRFGWERYVRGL